MPNTALPIRTPPATGRAREPDRLSLQAGGGRWTVAAADVVCIAELPATLTPLPHAPAPVAGLAGIGGQAVVVLDLAGPEAAGSLVAVAAGGGWLALRVPSDLSRGGDAPPLAGLLADIAPWMPPPGSGPARRPGPIAAAPPRRETLLMVACGGAQAALPAGRVVRVGVAATVQPLRDGGVLVRVDDTLLAARRLADALPLPTGGDGDPRWVAVMDGDEPALLVDRVLGLEPCDAASIVTVPLPNGRRQRWLNRAGSDPVPVMDDGDAPEAGPPPSGGGRSDGTGAVVTVLCGDLRLALPLPAVERVVGPGGPLAARPASGRLPVFDAAVALGRRARPRPGTLVHLRADGVPLLLSVDRVLGLGPLPAPWQTVEPLPPATALAIDAATPDGDGWLLRPVLLPAVTTALPRPLRRALAAARLGWAVPGELSD